MWRFCRHVLDVDIEYIVILEDTFKEMLIEMMGRITKVIIRWQSKT